MADKFVKDRTALKAVTNGVSGDVYYLTDQEEVYDAINTKLTLPNTGCFKIGSGVWAVLNREKTLNYRLTKPTDFVLANKYTKGTLITKDGSLYIANADIAENTTFAEGTTGATWKKIGSPAISAVGGATPTLGIASMSGGVYLVGFTDTYKTVSACFIDSIEFTAQAAATGAKFAVWATASNAGTSTKVDKISDTVTVNVTANQQVKISFTPIEVPAGWYVGMCGCTSAGDQFMPYEVSAGTVNFNNTKLATASFQNATAVNNVSNGWQPKFRYYYTVK